MIIECDVIANPSANIIWFKRTSERVRALTSNPKTSITNQLINSPTGPLSRSTLTINNVEASDNGNYICEASSGPSSPSVCANFSLCVIGKYVSADSNANCILIIIATSIIIAQGSVILTPHNHQIIQSGRAELNCSVCPTLTPMFTWNFVQKEGQKWK